VNNASASSANKSTSGSGNRRKPLKKPITNRDLYESGLMGIAEAGEVEDGHTEYYVTVLGKRYPLRRAPRRAGGGVKGEGEEESDPRRYFGGRFVEEAEAAAAALRSQHRIDARVVTNVKPPRAFLDVLVGNLVIEIASVRLNGACGGGEEKEKEEGAERTSGAGGAGSASASASAGSEAEADEEIEVDPLPDKELYEELLEKIALSIAFYRKERLDAINRRCGG